MLYKKIKEKKNKMWQKTHETHTNALTFTSIATCGMLLTMNFLFYDFLLLFYYLFVLSLATVHGWALCWLKSNTESVTLVDYVTANERFLFICAFASICFYIKYSYMLHMQCAM